MNEDFDWICNSPQLMNIPTGYADGVNYIHQLALPFYSPSPDDEVPSRLGLYYENLINTLLNNSLQLTDIERNISVRNGKITLGEFDFLGRDNDLGFHLECAIKFYLRIGSGAQLDHFIGPGKKDRLDIKWQRMLEHQLLLSKTEDGKRVCQELKLLPEAVAILLQGYLFHPYTEWNQNQQFHPAINPNHLRGWWIRENQLKELTEAYQFVLLRKPYWLSSSRYNRLNFQEMCNQLNLERGPQLIARICEDNHELDRGFIVPQDW